MKVKFLKTVGEPRKTYHRGIEYDLPKHDAEYYIRDGLAEKGSDPVKEKRPLKPLEV